MAIPYERLVAGEYKDTGIPLRDLEEDERELIQYILDEIHYEFIKEVAENRNMIMSDVEEIADGRIYTGKMAFELGLVDELGGLDEAEKFIEKKHNITVKTIEYKKKTTWADVLSEVMGKQFFNLGKGMSSRMEITI